MEFSCARSHKHPWLSTCCSFTWSPFCQTVTRLRQSHRRSRPARRGTPERSPPPTGNGMANMAMSAPRATPGAASDVEAFPAAATLATDVPRETRVAARLVRRPRQEPFGYRLPGETPGGPGRCRCRGTPGSRRPRARRRRPSTPRCWRRPVPRRSSPGPTGSRSRPPVRGRRRARPPFARTPPAQQRGRAIGRRRRVKRMPDDVPSPLGSQDPRGNTRFGYSV